MDRWNERGLNAESAYFACGQALRARGKALLPAFPGVTLKEVQQSRPAIDIVDVSNMSELVGGQGPGIETHRDRDGPPDQRG